MIYSILKLGFQKVLKLVPKWYQTSTDHSKFNIWVMTHLYKFIVNLSTELVPNWYRTGTVMSSIMTLGLKGLPRRLIIRKSFWKKILAKKIPSTIFQRTVQRNSKL